MTTMTPEQATWFAQTFDRLVGNVGQAVLGKAHVVRLTQDGPANTAFRVTCYGGGSQIGSGNYSRDAQGRALQTDGNGNYSGGQQCVYGQPGGSARIETTIGSTNTMTWY